MQDIEENLIIPHIPDEGGDLLEIEAFMPCRITCGFPADNPFFAGISGVQIYTKVLPEKPLFMPVENSIYEKMDGIFTTGGVTAIEERRDVVVSLGGDFLELLLASGLKLTKCIFDASTEKKRLVGNLYFSADPDNVGAGNEKAVCVDWERALMLAVVFEVDTYITKTAYKAAYATVSLLFPVFRQIMERANIVVDPSNRDILFQPDSDILDTIKGKEVKVTAEKPLDVKHRLKQELSEAIKKEDFEKADRIHRQLNIVQDDIGRTKKTVKTSKRKKTEDKSSGSFPKGNDSKEIST